MPLDPPPTTQAHPSRWLRSVVAVPLLVDRDRTVVWRWLQDPATFVDGQVWPYRVEFLPGPDEHAFTPGVRNSHHGPLLHLPAVVGEVRELEHRELVYLYGAFVGGFRFARPSRLTFDLVDLGPGRCAVTVGIEAALRPGLRWPWEVGNRWFWRRFGRWCEAATPVTSSR